MRCAQVHPYADLPAAGADRRDGHLEGQPAERAKEILAYELTKLVHGEEEAKKAQEADSVVSLAIFFTMPSAVSTSPQLGSMAQPLPNTSLENTDP